MENNDISDLKEPRDILKYLKDNTSDLKDMVFRTLSIHEETIYLVYNESLCDGSIISDFVIRSIKNTVEKQIVENIDKKISSNENDLNYKENKKETLEEKVKNKKEKFK